MARKPKPWFRAGRGWYSTVNGNQVSLGVIDPDDREAALRVLAELLGNPQNQVSKPSPSWSELVETFIAHKTARRLKPKTVADYRRALSLWLARFGTVARSDLTAEAIEDHALSVPTWNANTRRNYLCAVETFLRWCHAGITLAKPGRESSGAESVIREEVHWQAVGAAWGDLKPLLTFLWHTGARPSEATGLTAEAVDWEAGTVRLRAHKTRGTGRDRLIYLSPAALAILQQQRNRRTGGLLFRNRLGRAWRDKALAQAMWRISNRIGFRVTAYGYRHTYATRALERGVPDTHVAALLGHGSTRMIHAHYSHLTANARLLKEAAERVSRAG